MLDADLPPDADPAVATAEAGTPPQPSPEVRTGYRTVALIVAAALFMEFLDATVLATALPTMARDFGVRAPQMSIALTSYLLSLAIFIPASAHMADRFGGRTVFCAAIGVFMLGSLACAQAQNVPEMILARFFQGIGGAMMLPVGRLLLLRSVPKSDLINAMSWLLVPALAGPILGPPLGGFIVQWLNWRWIFYINLPVGAVAIWLAGRFIADVREATPDRFDTPGFVMSAVSLGCLLFGFEMTSRPGEALMSVPLLGVGVVTGAAYVRYALRRSDAILDLTLLRDPTFRLSVIAGSLTRITQGAQPFLLPLMMQLGFGYTPARSGSITVATAVGSLAMKSMAPRVLRRFGFRDALIWNGVIAAGCYAVCGLFRPDWPQWAIVGMLALCGFAMSFQFTAYNAIAYDAIPDDKMSRATSFYTTFQQLMLSLGICTGALGLRAAMLVRGHVDPSLGDFSVAFWVVTAISVLATIWNVRFARDAGARISGHQV